MAKDETQAKSMFPDSPVPAAHGAGTRIGSTTTVHGDLEAHEDLTVEGRFQGKITLPSATLTIARGARVEGEVKVRSLVLNGEMKGPVAAGERVQISETGVMEGDITTSKITVSNGARFVGAIKTSKA
ncbi:MAG TPA: polymer-forming cytoskeletal protein [Acidobacteriota bacterium]|nr:polymer-forming cytoskeletal protein [Acidobacteriota bacterium]